MFGCPSGVGIHGRLLVLNLDLCDYIECEDILGYGRIFLELRANYSKLNRFT
jgi:hypothetical protein